MPSFKLPAVFKDVKAGSQLLLFIFFWILFFVFFAVVSDFLVNRIFDLPPASEGLSQESIGQYKLIQFITSLGIFVLPPLLITGLFSENKWNFLKLKKAPTINSYILVFLILFFSLPILNILIEWNSAIKLPESMRSLELMLQKLEDDAAELTKMFLKADSIAVLFVNLFLIALVPAIGEELLFRGVFQQKLTQSLRNPHLGIWSAAFLFSLFHFQFFGFFPRMLLGGLFGYLFLWSRSLWVPIFAHFANNASAVIIHYFAQGNDLQDRIDAIGTNETSWYYVIPSALLLAVVLRFFYKEHQDQDAIQEDEVIDLKTEQDD